MRRVELEERGTEVLRCGAKRPVTAFAGTGASPHQNIFFDAGRNWAFRPTA